MQGGAPASRAPSSLAVAEAAPAPRRAPPLPLGRWESAELLVARMPPAGAGVAASLRLLQLVQGREGGAATTSTPPRERARLGRRRSRAPRAGGGTESRGG
jgi:hypothetical protein